MAKSLLSGTQTSQYSTSQDEIAVFTAVKRHNEIGFNETDRRATGSGRIGSISFNEADELFRSWIDENKWPYDAVLFDPRIFTFVFEKTSRLISSKPKAHLTPREGGDVSKAKINNALLDYQWDMANHGGSMISKVAVMDMTTRKYGASFSLCKWRYEVDDKGKCVFDGPDMQVLNNRDVATDLSATALENANWVQVRQYTTIQELERVNDVSRGKPVWKNLDRLRYAISNEATQSGGDKRSVNWASRNRQIAGLETDPVGRDEVFKVIELVTEYRRDRWITFAPKHGVILRDIPNPYGNNEIPITMLRYYAIDDDIYGLSEIEPVKGLQKAINALLCQYVDEINQNLYSPIAIGPGVRQHTLEWGKGARWIMNNPNSDFRLVESKSNAAAYFQSTYSVLVAAMMNALGESSLGISNVQPFQQDKTATEVKALQLQRNARDNFNQIFLAEMLKRQMMLWHSMNQKMLFSDKTKLNYIVRIAGEEALEFFKKEGMDEMTLPDEALDLMMTQQKTDPTDFLIPKNPVKIGKDYAPKLKVETNGKSGELHVEPEDLMGEYDFSIDVETMSANADDARRDARQTAVNLLVSNPNVLAMLQQQGITPKFKELFVSWLEELGFQDAERYFEAQSKGGMPSPDQITPDSRGVEPGAEPGLGPQLPPHLGEPGAPDPTDANGLALMAKAIGAQPAMSQNFGNPNQGFYDKLVKGQLHAG
jgi:hypothetical protein